MRFFVIFALPLAGAFTAPSAFSPARTSSTSTQLFAEESTTAASAEKKKVIILGGDGFCGWPTSLYLSDQGHDVVIVDNLSRRNIDVELGCDSLTPIQSPDVSYFVWLIVDCWLLLLFWWAWDDDHVVVWLVLASALDLVGGERQIDMQEDVFCPVVVISSEAIKLRLQLFVSPRFSYTESPRGNWFYLCSYFVLWTACLGDSDDLIWVTLGGIMPWLLYRYEASAFIDLQDSREYFKHIVQELWLIQRLEQGEKERGRKRGSKQACGNGLTDRDLDELPAIEARNILQIKAHEITLTKKQDTRWRMKSSHEHFRVVIFWIADNCFDEWMTWMIVDLFWWNQLGESVFNIFSLWNLVHGLFFISDAIRFVEAQNEFESTFINIPSC